MASPVIQADIPQVSVQLSFYFTSMIYLSVYSNVLEDIFADDTMIYRFTFQILDDQILEADHSSDLVITA